jgi:ubiquinone/menaquinone biosynthesis C-methylase UbiE
MRENKYDDTTFFEKYSQMNRSQQGLAGAGEWETLKKLLPDFRGKRVLDLGCGYGWHCIYAMENGAVSVIGVDISSKMLAAAREKTHFTEVEYRCCAMEDADYPAESFEIGRASCRERV